MGQAISTKQFEIKILEQGWLEGCEPEADYCSHGKIQLSIGGRLVADSWESGISESALALLTTLEAKPTSIYSAPDRLIFHGCGTILMMGCPIGMIWNVQHLDGIVRISDVIQYETADLAQATTFPGLSADVPEKVYVRQIVAFASKAKRLFFGATKIYSDDFDRMQSEAFWQEFDRLLAYYSKGL